MSDPGSVSVHSGSGAVSSSPFGIAKFGAPWASARALLVLVHGRDRESSELPLLLRGLAAASRFGILAPHAHSKTWYRGRYNAPYADNAVEIRDAISAIAGAFELGRQFGFGPEHIVLAGFSQGGCLVAEYLCSKRQLPAAAAIFTGALPDAANRDLGSVSLSGLSIYVSGGSMDAWLPQHDLIDTAEALRSVGATVRLELFPDGEHLVRPQELALLGELLDQIAA